MKCAVCKISASEFPLKPYSTDAGYCNEGCTYCIEENLRDWGICTMYMCVSKLQCSVESVGTIVDKFLSLIVYNSNNQNKLCLHSYELYDTNCLRMSKF